MLISLFKTSFDHFQFRPTSGMTSIHYLTVCLKYKCTGGHIVKYKCTKHDEMTAQINYPDGNDPMLHGCSPCAEPIHCRPSDGCDKKIGGE